MITSIGVLAKCKKNLEIFKTEQNYNITHLVFQKYINYTVLQDKDSDYYYIIDRNHNNIKIENNIFNKFFTFNTNDKFLKIQELIKIKTHKLWQNILQIFQAK